MPLDYHISPDEGLITISGNGDIRLGELTRFGLSLLRDANFDPELPQLLDFRGMRPVSEGRLDELRAFILGPYRDQVAGNVAVVIDHHLENRHGADIYLLTCSINEAELFSDYDQALKWLMRRAFATQPLSEHEYSGGDYADRAPE